MPDEGRSDGYRRGRCRDALGNGPSTEATPALPGAPMSASGGCQGSTGPGPPVRFQDSPRSTKPPRRVGKRRRIIRLPNSIPRCIVHVVISANPNDLSCLAEAAIITRGALSWQCVRLRPRWSDRRLQRVLWNGDHQRCFI